MGRLKRSKAESETEDNDNTPGQFMDKSFHYESISHMPEVSAMTREVNILTRQEREEDLHRISSSLL
jgi:hypothetical protein